MEWSLGLPPHKFSSKSVHFQVILLKQMKGTWNRFLFRLHHWPWLQHVKVKDSQFGPNASNENCTMVRVLFRIKYYYNSRKYLTLTFNLDIWPWCFEKKLPKKNIVISRDEKTAPRMVLLHPVRKLWFESYGSKGHFTFQGHLIFENSPFVPVHDWCKFRSDTFINSGDVAH